MTNYRVQTLSLLLSACLLCGESIAAECQAVAESTLAEISAGARAPLDAETAALIRQAAGAACVKTLSGRYPDAVAVEPDRVAENTTEAATKNPESQAAADPEEKEGGSSLWPFDSFKRNDVSASPSKKPYQRKR
jgi:hypothetical protein